MKQQTNKTNMRGTLHKTESGWQVWYHAKEDLFYGNTGVRILPLHDGDYFEVNRPGQYSEGKEVEFEIVANEGEPLGTGEQPYKQYAKLVDQRPTTMKGGEGWDKILDKTIQDKAEAFTDGHYHYRGKDAFIVGYKQGLKDVNDIVKKQISDFTIDLKESTSTYVKQNCEGAIFGLNRLLQALNKQDSEWITIKGDNITVNFKPMPKFDEPISLLNSIRDNSSWDTIIKEFHIATQQVEKGASPLIFEIWLTENYNPPTKKQD
jgi:hypothetical protein